MKPWDCGMRETKQRRNTHWQKPESQKRSGGSSTNLNESCRCDALPIIQNQMVESPRVTRRKKRLFWSLNDDNGSPTFPLPLPAEQDLPVCVDPPTLEEVQTAILNIYCGSPSWRRRRDGKHNALLCRCLQQAHRTCDQWTTNVIVPPKNEDLILMTNYREITLMSIAANVYNKVLLMRTPGMRIGDHVDCRPYITEKPSWLPPK